MRIQGHFFVDKTLIESELRNYGFSQGENQEYMDMEKGSLQGDSREKGMRQQP